MLSYGLRFVTCWDGKYAFRIAGNTQSYKLPYKHPILKQKPGMDNVFRLFGLGNCGSGVKVTLFGAKWPLL